MQHPDALTHTSAPDCTAHFLARMTEFLLRPRSPFWVARIGLAGSYLITCAIAAFATYSLNRLAFIGEHELGGWLVLVLSAALSVGLIADAFVNDLLSDRFRLPLLRRFRWGVLLAMSALWALMLFVTARDEILETLMLRFTWEALGAFLLALLDMMERMREVLVGGQRRRAEDREGRE